MARFLTLSKMEIHGFKSFYGRARFEFPPGITAVVGPNGCGKSNIGDAISWVLGEQKASSLRSDRMEDVIFNGSEARKPLGMAEVSLHFRNTHLRQPADAAGMSGGNGHGDGAGNGHGGNGRSAKAGVSAVAIETIVPIPEAVEMAATAPPEDGTAGDPPVMDENSIAGPLAEATEDGSRFYLENLPEEVVVTRRLYRSGESEYILNGERCRLRDIQDLLARTQVGTRLYATIEQGRIDQILSAKPKDRRAIIEEAAGILGYKNKRRQAELKLEAAQANLLRISDIAGEVEKQIGALKRQAAKARRYRRMVESQRSGRAVIAHRTLLALDEERRQTVEGIAALEAGEAEAAVGMARAEADLEALRLTIEEQERASHQRREAIHALDMEIDRLQGRLRSGQEQSRDLAARVAEAARDIVALETRWAEQEMRVGFLASELAAETERVRVAEAHLDDIETERRERTVAITARAAAIEEERTGLLRHLDEVADLSRRAAALHERSRAASADLERLEHDAAQSSTGRDALESAVTELETRMREGAGRLEEDRRDLERRRLEEKETSERLAARERRCEERRARAAALGERLEALVALEERRAGFAEGVAEILKGAAGFEPGGVVGEAIGVPAGLERAVVAALGPLVEAVVVRAPEEGARGVAHLRRTGAGRVSFVPIAAVAPEALREVLPPDLTGRPGVLGLLGVRIGGLASLAPVAAGLSKVILVESLDVATELRRLHSSWTFVTPQGDVIRADGVITGGEGAELHHGVLARRAERGAIESQIATLEGERRDEEATLAALQIEAAGRRSLLEEATVGVQDLEKAAVEIETRLNERRAELMRTENTLPLLQDGKRRLEAELAQGVEEAHDLQARAAGAETLRRGLEESIAAASMDLASGRQELERVQQAVSESGASLAVGRQRLATLARERETMEESARELRERGARRAEEGREWEARLAALGDLERDLRRDLERSLLGRAEAAAQDEAALAGLAYDRSLLHAREQTAKEGRAAHAAQRLALQERLLQMARLESDLRHIEAGAHEDLQLSLQDLRSRPPAMEEGRTLEDYEREAQEIRAALEAIGPVNLMAIEQCAELEERFGFLSAQKRDLDDSIASLRETIRTINRESRQHFLEAFDAVQAGFKECFMTLFGGGRAEMRLQEGEEDVLEAGIEIAAQPPGKTLQSIALLSGGEKALTAVALLFALFRYRPSPFCVLDEVDAPLDEANVGRFTRLLQQLTEETQFILITHNRKSMEAADLLYGVTMEEPGISKILPLRFE